MNRKKNKTRHWWKKRRNVRRLAMAAMALFVAAAGALYLLRSGGGEPAQYLIEPAPQFSLPTTAGDEFVLADHIGKHNVLLFFNEGIGCGACFDQIVDLEADWGRFGVLDVELVSIMVDPLTALEAEAKDRGITGIVASDTDKSVANSYDAMQASMHPGAKPGHTFVLVNKSGKMIWRWDWMGHGKPMYVEVDEIYGDVHKWLGRAG